MHSKKFIFLRYNSIKMIGTLLKKILLLSLLLTSLYSDAKLYIGTGYSGYSETSKDTDASNTSGAIKIKAGYGVREAYAVEISADYIQNTPSTEAPWSAKYAFNVDLIKAFDFGIYVNPFVKVGFGAGIIDNRDNNLLSKTYGSFNLGTGVYIPLSEHFDIEVCYTYMDLSYEKDNTLQEFNQTSYVNSLYLGINARF